MNADLSISKCNCCVVKKIASQKHHFKLSLTARYLEQVCILLSSKLNIKLSTRLTKTIASAATWL